MTFRFNPRPVDEKGIGLIRLSKPAVAPDVKSQGKPGKAGIFTVAAIAGAVGLGGVYLYFSDDSDNDKRFEQEVTEEYTMPPPAKNPPIVIDDTAERQLAAQNIREKEEVIFRDPQEALYEAYIGYNGNEVASGNDFAAHIGLFDTGCLSILFASGPYAGTRIGFFPVTDNDGPQIRYETVGLVAREEGLQSMWFTALHPDERVNIVTSMSSPGIKGEGAYMPGGAPRFEKVVRKDGQTAVAFSMKGDISRDSIFEFEIWNGDVYTINLKTGDFSIDSVFMNYPHWEPGMSVERNDFEVVKGRLDIKPGIKPAPAVPRP